MKRPHAAAIRHYALHHLGLKSYLQDPGDGRQQAQIAGSDLTWAVLLGRILQVVSFHETEWLVHSPARAGLGIEQPFRDDTLAYFTERLDPAVTRRALARLIRQAKRNKAFQDSPRIGLALDGTTAGRTHKRPCPLCRPLREKQGRAGGFLHKLVMVSVVGAGLSLPVDVEPYRSGDSEYAAGQRLLRRAVQQLGPHFADYVVVDAAFARGPFLEEARQLGLAVVARLKENLPALDQAARQRFHQRAPDLVLEEGGERIELCDADDFDPWEGLPWSSVRVMRYRQRKANGEVIEAYWLTNVPKRQLNPVGFYRMAKSRWEIENQGFNEAKNRYGLEHICHHQAQSLQAIWLLVLLAMVIERLYRLRYLHRGRHPVRTARQLVRWLWLSLAPQPLDSS